MKNRLWSILLVLCMILTLLPVSAFAAEIVDMGSCGENVTWTVDSDGLLTISGTGAMEDYQTASIHPYNNAVINCVKIQQGITHIGNHTFAWCGMTSVTIPDSVTSIGEDAFGHCKNLTSITIPDSVTSIGLDAFGYCYKLKEIMVKADNPSYCSMDGVLFNKSKTDLICCPAGKTGGGYTIPNSVTNIGDYAFAGCSSLTSVKIPNSVNRIGVYAFSKCSDMTSMTISDSVTNIDDYAFYFCSELNSLTIGNSVTSISRNAFIGCSKLSDIVVKAENPSYCSVDGVLFNKSKTDFVRYPLGNIGDHYTIPNGVTSIGDYSFFGCSILESLTIPEGVESIGDDVFAWCYGLTSITIPCSVTSIGDRSFWSCKKLTDVYYGGTKQQWNQMTIGKSNDLLLNATIHYASAPSPVPTETTSPTSPTAPTFENIEGKPISSKTNIAFNYNISETSTKGVWNLPYADSFLSGSAKKFHHDLAIISLGLTMASTNQTVGGKHTGAAYLQTMLEKMGFDKSSIQVSKQYADTQKQTDTCEYAFAVKKLTGSDDYLVCAVVRSNGYGGEWISNAHVFNGVNANHSAGFKGAADGMYTALQTYLNKLKVDKSHLRLWVTGFSRGGAVANLLGAKLTAESGIAADKIFVYGFAVPRTVQKTVKVRYENIFNIINQGDLVPRVPLQSWGYERYGIDKFLPCVSRNAGWYSNIQADMEKYFNKIMNTSVPTTIYSLMPAQERALDVLLAYLSDIIPSVYSYRSDGYQDAVMHACKGWQIDGEEISLDYITNRVFGMPAGHAKTLFGLFDDWSKQSKKEKALSVLAAIDLVTKWKDEDGTEQVKRVASAMLGYLVRLKAYEEADLINGAPYRELMNLISDQLARTKEKRNFASALLMQHWPETYLAWMMAGEEDEVFFDSSYQIMYIKCPVDVTVYDGNNRVAARIVNDKIDESIHGLYCEVNDYGEKIVFLPDDASYRTVVTAREKGAMDIVVQKYSAEDVLIDADCYISLPMQKSQTFQVNTASDSTVATNGKTLTPSKTLTESNRTVTISATAQNGGTVVGAGDYTLGATAELVAIPDTNYSFSGWYEKDKLLSAEDILHFSAVSDRTVTARFQKSSPSNPFTDVKSGAYYYDPVLWAVNHDPQITAGTSATTFSPDASCTRGQIVTFLWRANGQPEPTITKNPFTDVKPTDYFYKAVLWAVEKEITAGTSKTTFSPAATVTRAQTVTFLWRAEGKPAATAKNPFKDVPSGQYYTDAVLWAVKNEITAGTSATTFSPNNPCTRGQIVTFLYRDLAK